MKTYIKQYIHYIHSVYIHLINHGKTAHDFCVVNKVYPRILRELVVVALTGFLLSVALLPFQDEWTWYYSISYGLIPWLGAQILAGIKSEVFRK